MRDNYNYDDDVEKPRRKSTFNNNNDKKKYKIAKSYNSIDDEFTSENPEDEYFDPELRKAFIKKTFGLLCTQLLLTGCFTLIAMFNVDVKNFQIKNNHKLSKDGTHS